MSTVQPYWMRREAVEAKKYEAYWRSEISSEIYAYAEKVRNECVTPSAGVAIAAIISGAGDLVGKMSSEESK